MQHELDYTSAAMAAVAMLAAGGPAGAASSAGTAAVPLGSNPLSRAIAVMARRRAGRLVLGGMLLVLAACGEVRPAQLANFSATGNNGGSEHNLYFDPTGHAHFL